MCSCCSWGRGIVVLNVQGSPLMSCMCSLCRSLDKTVKMWEVSTGDLMYSLDELCSYVHSVAFDSSGEKVAVASGDGMAYIVSAWSDEVLQALKGHEVGSSSSCCLWYCCVRGACGCCG